MNKHILTLFIGLICSSSFFGQIHTDIKNVLATKDFVLFKKYAVNDTNKGIMVRCEYLRDLTTDFKEGVFIFEKSAPYPYEDMVNSIRVWTYRVTIITTKEQIAYYELSEETYKLVGDEYRVFYETIESFKSEKQFDSLKNSFKSIFKLVLNENELFNTEFVYGKNCADVRQQIDEWVTTKNKTELLKWLNSTITEKQIYAVDGLYQLKKAGVKITNEELIILKFVRNKNGTFYHCSGSSSPIQTEIFTVTKEFEF